MVTSHKEKQQSHVFDTVQAASKNGYTENTKIQKDSFELQRSKSCTLING